MGAVACLVACGLEFSWVTAGGPAAVPFPRTMLLVPNILLLIGACMIEWVSRAGSASAKAGLVLQLAGTLLAAPVVYGLDFDDCHAPGVVVLSSLVQGLLVAIGLICSFNAVEKDSQEADAPAELHCSACGYCLSGLTERRCPECGTEFEPQAAGP